MGWIVAGSLVLLGLPLYHLVPQGKSVAIPAEGVAAATRLALTGAALLWAARCASLLPRLRGSLTIIGVTGLISACMAGAYVVAHALGVPGPPDAAVRLWSFASFVLLLVAILRMPMSPPLGQNEGWTFPLDALVSVGGWAAVMWTLMAGSNNAPGPPTAAPPPALLYVATSSLVLAALNLLTLRGHAWPSQRAFVLFLVGQASHLVSLLLGALDSGDGRLRVWADVAYYGGGVPMLWSAWAIHHDGARADGREARVQWVRDFNPFALAMPLVTSAALLHTLRSGARAAVWPLASATAAVSVLLALRLGITIVENRRRMREEAERAAREQADRLEALRRIAGGVAHAFNNSLTVILGHADLGLGSSADASTLEAFARIREAGERTAGITRHLLWYTGRQQTSRERIRTGEWLRSLAPELQGLGAHGVTVDVVAPDVPGELEGDPLQLRAALFEIARNAVESMPEGGRVLVELDTAAGAAASGVHRITVLDSGHGIEPQHLGRVFEPFYRPGPGMPDSGMGLAVAHGVVRAHGGQLEAESTPGRGSAFRILLPTVATT